MNVKRKKKSAGKKKTSFFSSGLFLWLSYASHGVMRGLNGKRHWLALHVDVPRNIFDLF